MLKNPKMLRVPLLLSLLLFTVANAVAQPQSPTFTMAGEYKIHHTVFNSSFLEPEIAAIYGITRGKDKAVINVAVTKIAGSDGPSNSLGLPVQVSGVARNLMQQSTQLAFQQVQEQNATYYIADFEFDDQEIMHFYLDVTLPEESGPKEIEFTKKLYQD